jgi:glutamate-1-semialdehyde 2,1-aminomutase
MTDLSRRDHVTRTVDQSWALYDRATAVIPMGTQTHSKAPRDALRGAEPCFLQRGSGCRVWDVDGNEYIDFRCGLGPITLGYAIPEVNDAVASQLMDGVVFSYAHPLEVEVAETLVDIIPCAEYVRFLKTGGEAMAATHRLARGFTGRDHVITCGYHGWVNSMGRAGVPAAINSVYRALPWGDIAPFEAAFAELGEQIAAVSVACSYADIELGHQFLADLRTLTTSHGALLIFDEIVTGFRLARAGAQEYFGVTPDLAVFAKGMSNGVPLSAYLGRRDIMEKVRDVVISSTFGGDALGLAAAKAVMGIYQREDVIGTLWAQGRRLHDGIAVLADSVGVPVSVAGLPPVGQLQLPPEVRVAFEGECLQRGLILYTVLYPNYSHADSDIDAALTVMGEALAAVKSQGLLG